MATETTNYGLTKPEPNEYYDVGTYNKNLDRIDAQMKRQDEAQASHASQHSASGADPLTPDMIGALPIIDARSANYDMDAILKSGRHCRMYETNSTTLGTPYNKGVTPSAACTILSLANSNTHGSQFAFMSATVMYLRKMVNGVISDWVSIATTDYAVNKAGDTMTGFLKFYTDRGSVGTEYGDATTITFLRSILGDASYLLSISEGGPKYITGTKDKKWGTAYNILHTGNKPSGSYTGNGDATARTIETGGIGNVCFVRSGNSNILLTAGGAICFEIGTTNVSTIPYAEAHFVNGVITLTTVNGAINYNGAVYEYQVL